MKLRVINKSKNKPLVQLKTKLGDNNNNHKHNKASTPTGSKREKYAQQSQNKLKSQINNIHQRGASAITISSESSKNVQPPQVHIHVHENGGRRGHGHRHGPHCTHCHHKHHKSKHHKSSSKARRPGMWQSILNTLNPSYSNSNTSTSHTSNTTDINNTNINSNASSQSKQARADSVPLSIAINLSPRDGGIPWQIITDTPAPSNGNKSSSKKARQENVNMIKKIIKDKDIDINTQNPRDGTTLIIHSIIIGDFDLFQLLLKNGADWTIADYDGDDCIDYALLFQRYKICHLLLMLNKNMTEERIYGICKRWGKESKYMAKNVFGKFKDNLIDFVCKAIEDKGTYKTVHIFLNFPIQNQYKLW